jgi:hypothetical protein
MLRALKRAVGRVLNALGAPGFIRARDCHDRFGVPVEVRVEDLFTVVSVHNLRLIFHRLSGHFDGIVVEADDCQTALARKTDSGG